MHNVYQVGSDLISDEDHGFFKVEEEEKEEQDTLYPNLDYVATLSEN